MRGRRGSPKSKVQGPKSERRVPCLVFREIERGSERNGIERVKNPETLAALARLRRKMMGIFWM